MTNVIVTVSISSITRKILGATPYYTCLIYKNKV